MNTRNAGLWPELPSPAQWQATKDTLHMWTQIVGKIRMEMSPWVNHSWGSTLYVTSRGLTTSPIPCDVGSFSIDFDFIAHRLDVVVSNGETRSLPLRAISVAEFHAELFGLLNELGIEVDIFERPVEVPESIPFNKDTQHASYDRDAVNRYWRALVEIDHVFKAFRARFTGKVSPVHFFWGAFDLAVTRFSGRRAPLHPGGAPNCADWVMQEAYSHEVSSAGFWPGAEVGEAAFYAYAYPEPEGFREKRMQPKEAHYSKEMQEFVLPYEAVRNAPNPEDALLAFLQDTYEAAADAAGWDRKALEFELRS